jgi:hypothetical protein
LPGRDGPGSGRGSGCRACQARTDQSDRPDRTEAALANEPAESTEASEPAEPTDRIEPAEPMDRIDPAEPMDKMDPLEPMLRIEPDEPFRRERSLLAMWSFSSGHPSFGQPASRFTCGRRRPVALGRHGPKTGCFSAKYGPKKHPVIPSRNAGRKE